MNFVRSNKKDGRQNHKLQREKAFGAAPDADAGFCVKCGHPPVLEKLDGPVRAREERVKQESRPATEICERPKGAWGLPQKQTTNFAQKLLLLTPSKNSTARFELLKK